MSAEHAGKHQRGNRGEFAADATSPSKTSTTSSADLESMLKHALGRIDSLERQHEEMKTSVEIERRALREDISRLKEAHKALQALTERETKALRDDLKSLNRENKALEWSFFQLARKVQEGWEYPVADQPDEYWENKGYDEGAIECLRIDFLAEVETAVSELEHGVCDSITVGFVDHDEDLMPHWNALFQSFDLINPHGTGVVLDFQSIKLNEKVMRKICNHGIRRKNIGKVSFSNVGFANMRGAISELGIALESPKLKSFTWCENPIESTEDMNLFTRVLSQNSALDELEFTKNGNENAHALLSGVDFSTYKILNLSSNSLKTYGRTDIPDLIASNPPLVELDLRKNRLNNDDAVLIAQSLGRNIHLRRLDVGRNNIQERGTRALCEAVYDTSTLNALSDSNHSCLLVGLSEDFNVYAINWDSGANGLYTHRMLKIHRLMAERYRSGRGTVPHLNLEMGGGDSVLLAPFLMESVVRRHDAFLKSYDESFECSLGLVYELVKDWKMAELFSCRSELI